jgi:type IV pilus assembly protein PilA
MRYEQSHNQELQHQSLTRPGPHFRRAMVAIMSIALTASAYAIQDTSAVPPSGPSSATEAPVTAAVPNQQDGMFGFDLSKYMPLLEELGRLQEKMQREIQFPALRTQPKLLQQLPASTEIYLALPNYGDSLHQAVQIFHQELQENQTLRDGWQSIPMGPMVEDGLDKLYQLSQFLGNEIVVSAEIKPKGGSFVIVAEIRKPGLSAFLQGLLKQYGGAAGAPIRILTPQQLLTAKASSSKQQALVLVRPDLVVITSEMSTLKSFNAQLSRPAGKLAPTPFGQRLAQAYQGGAGILFAANLERLKSLVPLRTQKDAASFQQTGFADVKYLIAERKDVAGQTSNIAELTFTGPRRGVASWLTAPAPIGGLDFVSADAAVAIGLVLKNPAQLFDDIKSIAKISNPDVDAGLAPMEAALNIKLKEDLLDKIGKEVTVSVDGAMGPMPPWKVVLQVKDPAGMQQTLKKLLAAATGMMKPEQLPTLDEQAEGGQTYYTLRFLTGQNKTEVNYAFADGYMVIGTSRELVAEALRIHQNGTSLARSSGFQALRPQDRSADASAVFYQNFTPMLAYGMQQAPPEISKVLQAIAGKIKPNATFAYGEENSVRIASNGGGTTEAAIVAIIAAVAIPNLMRSRSLANEAGAAATVRTLSITESTYSNSYPQQGYAPDLLTLGPGPDAECVPSKDHACLIDPVLGCSSGTSGEWCTKAGYRYTITAICKEGPCTDFVAVGTPVDSGKGKSFCGTADGVIRGQAGPPLTSALSVSECQSWDPL